MSSPFTKWLGIAVLAGLFLLWAGMFIQEASLISVDGEHRYCLFDDAMISMRFAWNLAQGNGLVWNPGERVEGITNLLMALYMSATILVFGKDTAVLAVQVSGAFFILLVSYFTMRIGESIQRLEGIEKFDLASFLFFCCGLLYYPLNYWSLFGMETGLLTVLLLGAVHRILLHDGDIRFRLGPLILLGLAFWTRPDAAIPIALIMIYRWLGILWRKGWLRVAFLEALSIGLFVAAITAFRRIYYGQFVPNTYLLKLTGLGIASRIADGLEFIAPFARSMAIPFVVVTVALLLRWSRPRAFLLALFLAATGYEVWVGGDPWPYWRKMAPFVPLLFVLLVLVCLRLMRDFERWTVQGEERKSPSWFPRILVAVLFLAFASLVAYEANRDFWGELRLEDSAYFATKREELVNIGLILDEILHPNATIGVASAGTIPYFANRSGVDFLGKNDPYIASLAPDTRTHMAIPGHNKYDLGYSIGKLRPTYIQSARLGRQNVTRYVRENYDAVWYRGYKVLLLKDAKEVDWKKIDIENRTYPRARRK